MKKVGESFEVDEALVEIETDKITVEVPAPSSGSLSLINVKEGSDINIGGVLGIIEEAKNTKSDANKSNVEQIKKEESTKLKNTFKETNVSKEGNISPEKEKIQSSEIKNDEVCTTLATYQHFSKQMSRNDFALVFEG